MDELKLKQTSSTPEIYFHKNGNLEISGKVIPDLEIDFKSGITFPEISKFPFL